MTIDEALDILEDVRYKHDYVLASELAAPGILSIYWRFPRPDCRNPTDRTLNAGRSGDVLVELDRLTKEGLLRTVFGMTLRLEEHEAREWFLYQHHRMFDPHTSLLTGEDYRAPNV